MQQYHWYIILVRGGQEAKLIEQINSELVKSKLKKQVRELKIFSDKNKKNLLKGYIFCHCSLTSELVNFFYSIPRVISFLKHQRRSAELPSFVSPELVEAFSTKLKENKKNIEVSQDTKLNIGDLVKIIEGTFTNYEGKVSFLDEKKKIIKIEIDFAGRLTPVEIPIKSCQKVY